MKTSPDYEKDLASIRSMMERSSKFLSLSGLAGIMAGLYALAGTAIAWRIYPALLMPGDGNALTPTRNVVLTIGLLALIVLAASLATAIWLSRQKARRRGERLWSRASRRAVVNFAVPLITGGLFVLAVVYSGYFALVAPGCLIFYGLALFNVSADTYDEVRYLGFCDILLGLAAVMLPGFGLALWAIGFGVLHVVYGLIMYNKYDK